MGCDVAPVLACEAGLPGLARVSPKIWPVDLFWSALTCQRFGRRDLSRPGEVNGEQRGGKPPLTQSADGSAHSKKEKAELYSSPAFFMYECRLWLEPVEILTRDDKGSHHLRGMKVAAMTVEFLKPEFVAGIIRIMSRIRITSQVAEVLHQHKSLVLLRRRQILIFRNRPHHLRPRL